MRQNGQILRERALKLRDVLKKDPNRFPVSMASELRTHADTEIVVTWCARDQPPAFWEIVPKQTYWANEDFSTIGGDWGEHDRL